MTSFVIHLARATDRAANVERLRTALPGPVQVFDAVDARQMTGPTGYHRHLHRPPYPFALRQTEIACLHSHRAAWQAIADGPDDIALIVEDDVQLDPGPFAKALSLAQAQATPDNYIRLPIRNSEQGRVLAAGEGVRLIRPDPVGLGLQAQLVGRAAAARLLTATETFDRPVDTLLQMTWITGQPVDCVLPSGVSEISGALGGSTIGRRLGPGAKLYRELARPLYRLALRAAARKHRS